MAFINPRWEKKANEYTVNARYMEARRGHMSYSGLRDEWEKAGDAWNNAGDLRKAEQAYDHALKYANQVGGSGEIKEKMKNARGERLRLYSGLKKNSSRLEEKLEEERKKGQKKLYAIFSIASFIFALAAVSFNLTGNAIGNIASDDFRWLGLCFFVCGLIFAFVFLKGKK